MLPLLVWALVAGACSDQAPPAVEPAAPTLAPVVVAPADDASLAQLARETLEAIHRSDMQLTAAIRQQDGSGGLADFHQHITGPLDRMQTRWATSSAENKIAWMPCVVALQEELNRYSDSWKAGEVVGRGSLLRESLQACATGANA